MTAPVPSPPAAARRRPRAILPGLALTLAAGFGLIALLAFVARATGLLP